MKRLLLAFLPLALCAQTRVKTAPMSFDIDASAMPSKIDYIDGSLQFVDVSGDNTIGANETCYIQFLITNNGDGDGHGCEARIRAEGTTSGITCMPVTFPRIQKGDTVLIKYPIKTNHQTQNGSARFIMEIYEPNGLGTGDIAMNVTTHQFDPPRVEVGEYVLKSDKGQLQRKEKFILQIPVQNLAQGVAEDVKITIKCPSGILLVSENYLVEIPRLRPNEAQVISYEMIPAVNAPDELPFEIEVDEKYGKYAKGTDIRLQLGKRIAIGATIASTRNEDVEIRRLSLISDVDRDIPVTSEKNPNTFVLIIANEHYQQVAAVPYALNDGRILAKYCQRTLGIPASNIKVHENATYNDIRLAIEWLKNVCEKYEGEASVIFYYAGHGIPDPADKSAYLLPVDGDGRYVATGYKLDELYKKLGEMPSKSMTILLDACFSGANRDGKMLASERGVALKSKSGVPQGNMVVFSAAQEDETALPYEEEGHGMFTYYILKKLQETEGNITLQELSQYVIREVGRKSAVTNKPQTPCVTPSAEVGTEWKTWTLK